MHIVDLEVKNFLSKNPLYICFLFVKHQKKAKRKNEYKSVLIAVNSFMFI